MCATSSAGTTGTLVRRAVSAWMFDKKGSIVLDKKTMPEEELMELALDAGAEDVKDQGDQFEVITSPEEFLNVKTVFDEKAISLRTGRSHDGAANHGAN